MVLWVGGINEIKKYTTKKHTSGEGQGYIKKVPAHKVNNCSSLFVLSQEIKGVGNGRLGDLVQGGAKLLGLLLGLGRLTGSPSTASSAKEWGANGGGGRGLLLLSMTLLDGESFSIELQSLALVVEGVVASSGGGLSSLASAVSLLVAVVLGLEVKVLLLPARSGQVLGLLDLIQAGHDLLDSLVRVLSGGLGFDTHDLGEALKVSWEGHHLHELVQDIDAVGALNQGGVIGSGQDTLLAVVELCVHDDHLDFLDLELLGNVDPGLALVGVKVAAVNDHGLRAVLGLEGAEGHGLTGLSVAQIVLVDADKLLSSKKKRSNIDESLSGGERVKREGGTSVYMRDRERARACWLVARWLSIE